MATQSRPSGRPRSERPGASPRKATAIDKHVGRRLRRLRQINEVSLERLAELVDLAPQQIQKYEIGETRISASRIFELARIFRVSIEWFYADLEAATRAQVDDRIRRRESEVGVAPPCVTPPSPADELAARYAELPPDMQAKLMDFARMLSDLAGRQRN
ncbi:MAG TPA: helix-turn-helix transcriptional regulator [Hyphomicrobiaceae bacterium]|nr:helix-turn-helix transcriptional regulator [Hyphomicrobiaceae bacterium]